MQRIVTRTLSRELRLDTDSDEAFATLSYLGADPSMPGREHTPVDLTVEPVGKFYRVALPGREPLEGSLYAILNSVFELVSSWLVEDARNMPVMHSATAEIEGRRFTFTGGKGFGKTTLMLKLIEQGVRIQGDENLIITAAGSIPRPRRLHVKEGSLDVVPSLFDAITSSPFTTDWAGNRVFACSPAMTGMPWQVTEGPLEHIVFVEPNFGGSSVISPVSRNEAFTRLLETVYMPATNRGAAAARLHVLCRDAKAWRLQAGDPDQAVRHLRKVAQLE